MRRPLIERPRAGAALRRRERGVTMALVALAIFSIIAMAGLSIDIGTLYEASAEAQRSADAAALAGARAISVSGITGAADPTTQKALWQEICSGSGSIATGIATAVAQQNLIGGLPPPISGITVTYTASTTAVNPGNSDCSAAGTAFGINPVVTVKVTQSALPTYFAKIWGRRGNTVSATASAEVFNPSASENAGPLGEVVPVQPRCVKPWMVPNSDPVHGDGSSTVTTYCNTGGTNPPCAKFVSTTDGAIANPGIYASNPNLVIGERLWLLADCTSNAAPPCTLMASATSQPQANFTPLTPPRLPNLQYVPGQANFSSIAVPADGSDACNAVTNKYSQAIAGCDQLTQYTCGKPGNVVDLSENPAVGDTVNGAECLIHETALNSPSGQDSLAPFITNVTANPNYPFQIQAGTGSPLIASGVGVNDVITSSGSIVSIPIYDNSAGATLINGLGTTPVTIVGFLQVFIYSVDTGGAMQVAVMNVSGCGNAATNFNYVTGTSPVPVRLITAQ